MTGGADGPVSEAREATGPYGEGHRLSRCGRGPATGPPCATGPQVPPCSWRTTGRYGCAFGRIGLIADAGLLWSLPARVGLGTAKRLLLFGDVLDSGEAAALGLPDVLCEPGSARQDAVRPAGRLAEGAQSSIAETKRILTSWPAELAEDVRAQPRLPAGADFAEGSSAF
ncbi:enoyl-CoA hydratase/isomerase family protein [Streptomyces sp. GESEQ-4]|uniref:enoyl-CoA hydratase/isomerase family protein n=1 Tax=Streptomyces sp. GESEQ-4 TaxID=2812655 RepID=UPI001B32ADAF|nr:enoyl-CoA hydratase-related protein [Streptomyces sp. GESEQ-4]